MPVVLRLAANVRNLIVITEVFEALVAESGVVKAELFPPEVRALGVGLPYAIANAMFGGTAEYVALSLKSSGYEAVFFWYVAAMALVALIAALWMPDTRARGYLEGDGRI